MEGRTQVTGGKTARFTDKPRQSPSSDPSRKRELEESAPAEQSAAPSPVEHEDALLQ